MESSGGIRSPERSRPLDRFQKHRGRRLILHINFARVALGFPKAGLLRSLLFWKVS